MEMLIHFSIPLVRCPEPPIWNEQYVNSVLFLLNLLLTDN